MKTQRVRIAVAISKSGNWTATGWNVGRKIDDEELSGMSLEALDDEGLVHFIEADVPLPETPKTIEGTITPNP